MRLLLFSVIIVLCSSTSQADITVLLNSTCRITSEIGIRGSGVCYQQSSKSIWILTAGHCVLDKSHNKTLTNLSVQFFFTGKQSKTIPAKLLFHIYKSGTTDDIAVLKIQKADCHYPLPHIITVPKYNYIKTGDTFWTYGCAQGRWPTAYKGTINFIHNGELRFFPPPLGGRSGSGIFDSRDRLIGIIVMKGSSGKAIPFTKFYKLIPWTKTHAKRPISNVQK